jgi:hypothetical protein
MDYGQYLRIEQRAGFGVACTNREFIRAARSILNDEGRSRAQRTWRHKWLNEGLALLADAKAQYQQIIGG